MKKVLSLAVLMSEISFGMLPGVGDSCVYTEAVPKWEKCSAFVERPCRHKLDEYINSYNSHQAYAPIDYVPIDSAIFKDALLEEIGQDEIAQRIRFFMLVNIKKYSTFGYRKILKCGLIMPKGLKSC